MAMKCPRCGSFDVQSGLAERQCLACGATIIDGVATGGVEVHDATTTREARVADGSA